MCILKNPFHRETAHEAQCSYSSNNIHLCYFNQVVRNVHWKPHARKKKTTNLLRCRELHRTVRRMRRQIGWPQEASIAKLCEKPFYSGQYALLTKPPRLKTLATNTVKADTVFLPVFSDLSLTAFNHHYRLWVHSFNHFTLWLCRCNQSIDFLSRGQSLPFTRQTVSSERLP